MSSTPTRARIAAVPSRVRAVLRRLDGNGNGNNNGNNNAYLPQAGD